MYVVSVKLQKYCTLPVHKQAARIKGRCCGEHISDLECLPLRAPLWDGARWQDALAPLIAKHKPTYLLGPYFRTN